MDPFVRQVYLDELLLQCDFALNSFGQVREALARKDTHDFFRETHHFLAHVSNVSKLLWPPPGKKPANIRANMRAKELRAILNLPDQHPLEDRKLRNHLEHYDDRLDDWVESSPRRVHVDMSWGPIGAVTAGGIRECEVMRLFDPKTWVFTFRGEEFNLQSFWLAISEVLEKTQAARSLPQ